MKNNWTKIGVYALGGVLLGGVAGFVGAPNGVDQVAHDKVLEDLKVLQETNNLLALDNIGLTADLAESNKLIDTSKLSGEDLNTVLDYVYDNYGDVEVLTEDLDNPEDIVERVNFLNEIKEASVQGVKNYLFEEIDGNFTLTDDNSVIFDEDELERLRVNDRSYELGVTVNDWEDQDGSIQVTGTFRQNETDYTFTADAEFKDGEYDELTNIKVTQIQI